MFPGRVPGLPGPRPPGLASRPSVHRFPRPVGETIYKRPVGKLGGPGRDDGPLPQGRLCPAAGIFRRTSPKPSHTGVRRGRGLHIKSTAARKRFPRAAFPDILHGRGATLPTAGGAMTRKQAPSLFRRAKPGRRHWLRAAMGARDRERWGGAAAIENNVGEQNEFLGMRRQPGRQIGKRRGRQRLPAIFSARAVPPPAGLRKRGRTVVPAPPPKKRPAPAAL